jgi:hypothetical protein
MASHINPPKLTAFIYAALVVETDTLNHWKKLFLLAVGFHHIVLFMARQFTAFEPSLVIQGPLGSRPPTYTTPLKAMLVDRFSHQRRLLFNRWQIGEADHMSFTSQVGACFDAVDLVMIPLD